MRHSGAGSTKSHHFNLHRSTNTAGATPVTFVAGTSTIASSNSNTTTLNVPAGTIQNDLLITWLYFVGTDATTSPGTGWSQVGHDDWFATASTYVFTHVAGASEPASYTWTWSISFAPQGGLMVAYRHASAADGICSINHGNGNSETVATKTPSVVGDMWLAFGWNGSGSNVPTVAAFTARISQSSVLAGSSVAAFEQGPLTSTNPTGTASMTGFGANNAAAGSLLIHP